MDNQYHVLEDKRKIFKNLQEGESFFKNFYLPLGWKFDNAPSTFSWRSRSRTHNELVQENISETAKFEVCKKLYDRFYFVNGEPIYVYSFWDSTRRKKTPVIGGPWHGAKKSQFTVGSDYVMFSSTGNTHGKLLIHKLWLQQNS